MPTEANCTREIETLHDFFAEWYCGDCDRAAFERVERALADGFQRVAPDGSIDDRTEILESIRGAYDGYAAGAFEIEIRNVEAVATIDDRALVRYEEWQTSPSGTNGRLSTALFAPSPAGAVEWHYLQETWLDSPE